MSRMSELDITRQEDLQRIAEFDHPFTVTAAGALADAPAGIYAPNVWHDETTDIDMEGAEDKWEALTDYTGQHGYSGAVMHASEYLGGGIARDILDTPGVYVVVVVNVLPEDECRHCGRFVENVGGSWIDPAAPETPEDGDDHVWREQCDSSPYFDSRHERDEDPEPAGWSVLRLRHVNYPHYPGYLYDCAACEVMCHCTPGASECVWSGHES